MQIYEEFRSRNANQNVWSIRDYLDLTRTQDKLSGKGLKLVILKLNFKPYLS